MGAPWLARAAVGIGDLPVFHRCIFRGRDGTFYRAGLHWLFPHASHHAILPDAFSIRKCAHVTEYFVFSLLVLEAIRGGRRGWNRTWGIWAISIAAIYASTDEIHQLFVPSRGASVVDVMIDISGAALAQFFMSWWTSRHGRPKDGEPLVKSINSAFCASTHLHKYENDTHHPIASAQATFVDKGGLMSTPNAERLLVVPG